MGYKWENDYVIDGNLKDGWYYIRTWDDMKEEYGSGLYKSYIKTPTRAFVGSMETSLPPTRCIHVQDGIWKGWCIVPEMVASPAFTIGKEYEFSCGGEQWIKSTYTGYEFNRSYNHQSSNSDYVYCREIPEKKEPVIKLMIDDKEVTLSEETIKQIKEIM